MKKYKNLFNKIIEPENLFMAWDEFKKGKTKKKDVMEFEKNLEQNIFDLQRSLKSRTYKHGPYSGFSITDPKLRRIHKATVRDRVLHHAVFKILYPVFEPTFIPNSFSCRIGKGTHKGVSAVSKMLWQESRNNTHTCYALKCDVKKFFDSIDHSTLLDILKKRVEEEETLWLLEELIGSYSTKSEFKRESLALRAKEEYLSAILLLSFLQMST